MNKIGITILTTTGKRMHDNCIRTEKHFEYHFQDEWYKENFLKIYLNRRRQELLVYKTNHPTHM